MSERERKPLGRLFRQDIVLNVLNPKTALFFFAFLPQFVDVDAGAVAAQIAVLGMIFVLLGLVSDGAYALVAGCSANDCATVPECFAFSAMSRARRSWA